MAACKGTNKKGEPCKAAALKGRDVCLAHADEETRTSVNFQQGPRPGRPRVAKPTEVARRVIEENVAALLRPHFRALGLELHDDLTTTPLDKGAIVVYQGEATTIEDLGAQIAAAEKLLDRVYGKPRQQVDVSTDDPHDGAALIEDPDLRREARALLRRAAGLGEDVAGRSGAGDE